MKPDGGGRQVAGGGELELGVGERVGALRRELDVAHEPTSVGELDAERVRAAEHLVVVVVPERDRGSARTARGPSSAARCRRRGFERVSVLQT